ncbi:MAG TPA: hypothetical protein VHH35_17820 [Pyrinomonadaceae bacterium]|nr:hypothetical protein [Pyrinomonadaceae bacterium]
MSDAISAIIPQIAPQAAKTAGIKPQEVVGRSFQAVLQDGDTRPRTVQNPEADKKPTTEGVSGASLEQLRDELTRRLDRIPTNNKSSFNDLWPELMRTHTRMGLLREAMKGIDNTPTGTNLKGVFGKVENEWFNLEQIMRSDKDLSSGELLGLQARLYQVSQHIDVMSKVVDQMTSGIKTILNTNV